MSAESVAPTTENVAPTDPSTPCSKAEAVEEPTALELLEHGIALADTEDAVDVLSRALEKIVAQNGELHPSTAKFYHEYGRALVESSKAETDVFAKIELETKKGEDEKQENPAASDENQPAAKAAEEASPSAVTEEPTPTEPTESTSGKSEAPAVPEPTEGKPNAAEASAEMVEAREVAWELLETARVVYEKSEEEKHLEIASVHCLLGDISMEDGNFARAYQEYVKATQLFGKHAGVNDRRLGSAHQLAGLCSLYDQQNEASIFHYTAAAEAFNNALTEILVKHEIMERPDLDTEDIEFVDEANIEKMKAKVGEENDAFKEVQELNGIVNNLIERVEEIQEQMEADAQNPKMQELVAKLGKKLAEKFAENQGGATSASGFDQPTTAGGSAPCEGATEINVLVPKKRPAPATSEAAAKKPRQD